MLKRGFLCMLKGGGGGVSVRLRGFFLCMLKRGVSLCS